MSSTHFLLTAPIRITLEDRAHSTSSLGAPGTARGHRCRYPDAANTVFWPRWNAGRCRALLTVSALLRPCRTRGWLQPRQLRLRPGHPERPRTRGFHGWRSHVTVIPVSPIPRGQLRPAYRRRNVAGRASEYPANNFW